LAVFLVSVAPHRPPPPVTHCMNTCTPLMIHTGKGGGGEGVDEPVRKLEGR
jgi:hypothetical protein